MNSFLDDASWIWLEADSRARNTYTAFRLSIPEAGSATSCTIRVGASSAYRLYVNGVYLGRGPVRAWEGHVGIDAYDLSPFLGKGRMVLTALVHFHGESVPGYPIMRPGFLLQGCVDGRAISTGLAEWHACPLNAWAPEVPRISENVGFNEDLDMAGYDPAVWEQGSGSDWRLVAVIESVCVGRAIQEPRSIPLLRESWVQEASRLLAAGEYEPAAGPSGKRADAMNAERHAQMDSRRIHVDGNPWPVRVRPGRPVYVVVDIGRMTAGALCLDIQTERPVGVRIGYADQCRIEGRSFLEAQDALSQNPLDNLALRVSPDHGGRSDEVDRLMLRAGVNAWESPFNIRGFRYVKLSFDAPAGDVVIRSLRAREVTYPVDPRGKFRCSDARLDAIWDAGELTTRLCMADTYLDNPSRERRQYGGDGFLQSLYAYGYFGDTALWRHFLFLYAQGMRPDKAVQSGGPWMWNQIIPAWTLLWIESIREYTELTGDVSVMRELADGIEDAMLWFSGLENGDGLLQFAEKWDWTHRSGGVLWNFIDWQGVDGQLRGEPAWLALNSMHVKTLGTAASLMERARRAERAAAYRGAQARAMRAMKALFGDPGREAARQEHAVAYATWAGIVAGRMGDIASKVLRDACETDLFCFGLLAALEREGHEDAILAFVRNVLGKMLADGAVTFYETRRAREKPGRALCQAIGGFAGYWLPRTIAGIREVSAEKRRVVVRPHLGDLEWVECTAPCPDGDIRVSIRRLPGGEMKTDIEAPRGWQGIVGELPSPPAG